MVKNNVENCHEYRERRRQKKLLRQNNKLQSLTSAQLMNADVDIANNTPTSAKSSNHNLILIKNFIKI